MSNASREEVLGLIRARGAVRPQDLEAAGHSRMWLTRLVRAGQIERVRRGVYVAVDAEWTENHAFVEIAKQAPRGVICLLSALRFHELTTQLPFEVWLAFERSARVPKGLSFQVQTVRFSGVAFSEGLQEHIIEGVPVRIYSPAKTVADCFKYRHKFGFDVALEALRDCYRMRLATMDELWDYAKLLRVANVMRPYLESLQ